MFSRSLFHHRPSAIVRAIALFALLLVIALAATIAVTSRSAARARRLSFEDRVAAQRAIEAVYHRHRLWPADNPQPKPALDEVLPEAALRAKVEDYLRQSRALELRAGTGDHGGRVAAPNGTDGAADAAPRRARRVVGGART
jgi:hypothetical protein